MKTYLVIIETRKGDRDETLGPFTSFEKAREAFLEEEGWTKQEWENYAKYDSSFEKGTLYTEEISVNIVERELK